MKYIANPVEVDAFKIVGIGTHEDGLHLALENGKSKVADAGQTARFLPAIGDYYVVQSDGYVYLNPASVFERKYRLNEPTPATS